MRKVLWLVLIALAPQVRGCRSAGDVRMRRGDRGASLPSKVAIVRFENAISVEDGLGRGSRVAFAGMATASLGRNRHDRLRTTDEPRRVLNAATMRPSRT